MGSARSMTPSSDASDVSARLRLGFWGPSRSPKPKSGLVQGTHSGKEKYLNVLTETIKIVAGGTHEARGQRSDTQHYSVLQWHFTTHSL
jgi:hypothetical protein